MESKKVSTSDQHFDLCDFMWEESTKSKKTLMFFVSVFYSFYIGGWIITNKYFENILK